MTDNFITLEMNEHQTLVHMWAKKMAESIFGLEYDDFYSIGLVGLWDGILKFDPSRKYPKNKFYSWRIITKMLDYKRTTTGSRSENPRIPLRGYEDELHQDDNNIEDVCMQFSCYSRDIDSKIDLEILMRRAKLTKRQLKLVRLRDEGYKLKEISKMYGVTEPCIHQWIKGGGGERKTPSIIDKLQKANLHKAFLM